MIHVQFIKMNRIPQAYYTVFRDLLASTMQPASLFCYGETVHARFEPTIGLFLGGIVQIQYSENQTSLNIHESLAIYDIF